MNFVQRSTDIEDWNKCAAKWKVASYIINTALFVSGPGFVFAMSKPASVFATPIFILSLMVPHIRAFVNPCYRLRICNEATADLSAHYKMADFDCRQKKWIDMHAASPSFSDFFLK
jgi:hypothetical protein